MLIFIEIVFNLEFCPNIIRQIEFTAQILLGWIDVVSELLWTILVYIIWTLKASKVFTARSLPTCRVNGLKVVKINHNLWLRSLPLSLRTAENLHLAINHAGCFIILCNNKVGLCTWLLWSLFFYKLSNIFPLCQFLRRKNWPTFRCSPMWLNVSKFLI